MTEYMTHVHSIVVIIIKNLKLIFGGTIIALESVQVKN